MHFSSFFKSIFVDCKYNYDVENKIFEINQKNLSGRSFFLRGKINGVKIVYNGKFEYFNDKIEKRIDFYFKKILKRKNLIVKEIVRRRLKKNISNKFIF